MISISSPARVLGSEQFISLLEDSNWSFSFFGLCSIRHAEPRFMAARHFMEPDRVETSKYSQRCTMSADLFLSAFRKVNL